MSPGFPVTIELVNLAKLVWHTGRNTNISRIWRRVNEGAFLMDFWEEFGRSDRQPVLIMSAKEGLREPGKPDKISHDISAAFRILDSLENTYRRNDGNILNYERIELDGDNPNIPNEKQETNIISVGGPHVNDITSVALDSCSNGYRFGGHEGRDIIDKVTDEVYAPTTPSENGWVDLGLVGRIPNPLDPTSRGSDMIIICGSYGPGTVAGARFFNRPDLMADVYEKDNRYFQAVLNVQVNRLGAVSKIDIEDEKPFVTPTTQDIRNG